MSLVLEAGHTLTSEPAEELAAEVTERTDVGVGGGVYE